MKDSPSISGSPADTRRLNIQVSCRNVRCDVPLCLGGRRLRRCRSRKRKETPAEVRIIDGPGIEVATSIILRLCDLIFFSHVSHSQYPSASLVAKHCLQSIVLRLSSKHDDFSPGSHIFPGMSSPTRDDSRIFAKPADSRIKTHPTNSSTILEPSRASASTYKLRRSLYLFSQINHLLNNQSRL